MNANMLIEIREETLYELYEEGGGGECENPQGQTVEINTILKISFLVDMSFTG